MSWKLSNEAPQSIYLTPEIKKKIRSIKESKRLKNDDAAVRVLIEFYERGVATEE